MTEGRALLLAAGLHLLLLLGLSLGLATHLSMVAEPDVTPVEFVNIADVAQVTEPPKPSMEAAPREVGPPAPAESVAEAPALPTPPVPDVKAPDDTTPQDAIAEQMVKPPKAKPAPAAKAKESFDPGAMASLIDKSKPEAPVKPKDTSQFAKTIEKAIPKNSKLSAIQAATLEQAIRAQIAPCWNPPIGGADVQGMTAVLRIKLNRDGSVAAAPEFVSQSGATAGNQAYARAFVETAKRAVLRCAPLQLPDALFPYWKEFELNFDPRLMT